MLKTCVAGIAAASCITAAVQLHLMHAQGLQDDFAQLETIRRNPNGPNPYLYGPERFGRFMSIMVEGGRARLAAMGKGV